MEGTCFQPPNNCSTPAPSPGQNLTLPICSNVPKCTLHCAKRPEMCKKSKDVPKPKENYVVIRPDVLYNLPKDSVLRSKLHFGNCFPRVPTHTSPACLLALGKFQNLLFQLDFENAAPTERLLDFQLVCCELALISCGLPTHGLLLFLNGKYVHWEITFWSVSTESVEENWSILLE